MSDPQQEQRHTPGPWWEDEECINHVDGVVARIPKMPANQGNWAGNARLIAAAPDLLAFAERALRYGDLPEPLATEARNAISKAKGA